MARRESERGGRLSFCQPPLESCEGSGNKLYARSKEASKYDLVKSAVGSSCEEFVQLYEQFEVDIVALRGLAVAAA